MALLSLRPLRTWSLGFMTHLGFSANKSEEEKARGRSVEIKNGRLAMLAWPHCIAKPKFLDPFHSSLLVKCVRHDSRRQV